MSESPVLIHVWQVDPAETAAAVKRLDEMFGGLADDPGFVSARVLGSPDRTSLAAAVEMRTPEDRRRLEESPEVRDILNHLHGTANLIIKVFDEVATYPA